MTSLGQHIADLSAELQQCRTESTNDSPKMMACEEALQDALDEMRATVTPPARWWQSMIMTPADSAAIQVAFKAKVFEHIPQNSPIDIRQLSNLAQVPENNLVRVLRLLVLNRILAEPKPGHFAHTPLSLAAKTSQASKGAGFLYSMFSRAGAGLAEAINSPREGYTAWEAAFGTPVYQFFENNPTEREQFGTALATLAAPEMEDLAAIFPWGSLGKLVDVGGGAGHVATTLARQYPELRIINQDLPGVIEDCKQAVAKLPLDDFESEVFSRIDFEPHNFYDLQPESDADGYLLRQCLHNNSDTDCVKVLKALVPGLLTPGARLLINETVLGEETAGSNQKAKRLHQKDLMAMTIGAKERTRAEFLSLLKAADERYEIDRIYIGKGDLALLSAKLTVPP
ncbi:O-methyltransferase-domain-containing protein [Lophiotrema nucula]|uniref:O-methyltransferase-domain-containing protein n=1 Tax=Lophiotrema nucula TaxID=690887 RepID=A0A6A5YH20_9PLEO|nr:O-methyltransferase-domain-containing protein [Lophiotrema nucula]